jgi:CpeT protein
MSNNVSPVAIEQDLNQLVQWMAGDFSNQRQSMENPRDFAHIHVIFRPLPVEFFGGIGMYSEQVYDYDRWTPYRQGVHRFGIQDGEIFVENFGLIEPMLYAGSGRERSILTTITPQAIQPRCGCGMVFRREGAQFIGQVEPGKKCLIPKEGKTTYLVSEVAITDTTWVSRDRGFDCDTDELVWGSEFGKFQFEKIEDFSSELPALSKEN